MSGKRICLGALALLAAATAANAELMHRYDFNTVNDTVGTANGTLVGGASLSGGALVTDGGNGASHAMQMTLDSSAVSGLTGAFTVETWFHCTTGWPKFDTTFSFSDGTTSNYLLATPVRGGDPWQSSVAMKGAGGTATGGWDYLAQGIYLDTPGVHQQLVTYDGTTLTYYVDGVLANYASLPATVTNAGFNLSTLTSIGINGGSPYNDPSLTGSTSDFRIYNQALTAGQVASIFALGSDASNASISAAVPEPASLGLLAASGLALLVRRRKIA